MGDELKIGIGCECGYVGNAIVVDGSPPKCPQCGANFPVPVAAQKNARGVSPLPLPIRAFAPTPAIDVRVEHIVDDAIGRLAIVEARLSEMALLKCERALLRRIVKMADGKIKPRRRDAADSSRDVAERQAPARVPQLDAQTSSDIPGESLDGNFVIGRAMPMQH